MSNEDVKVYQDKKAKAEDFTSSAYTLFITGVLGLAALILMELGVLPIQFAAPAKYFTYAVMGGLFVVFIIIGIVSFRSSKIYEKEAEKEENLTSKIKDWAHSSLSVENIVELADCAEESQEEARYFAYFAVIKKKVEQKFGTLETSYLESICEELYAEIFEADS